MSAFDHKDLFFIQSQIDSVASRLSKKLKGADDLIAKLLQEIKSIEPSEGKDDQFGQLDELEQRYLEVQSLYENLESNWDDIFVDAARENKFSHQLFNAVLDKFGKPTEFGHCWQFDEEGLQTWSRLHTVEETGFTFAPFPLENVAGWYDVSDRDQDHFDDVVWNDSDPDWIPEVQDTIDNAVDDTIDNERDYDDYDMRRNPKPIDRPDVESSNIEFDYNGRHYEYQIGQKSRGYDSAVAKCEGRRQEMLRIQDQEELDYVIGKIKAVKSENLGQILTGLQIIPETTGWAWELKAARNRLSWYEGWAVNEPKNQVNARCASMTATGWKSLPCDRKLPYYVCLGRVSADSKSKRKHEYRFFIRSGAFDYQGAVKGCQEVGFQLAIIPSSHENQQLKQLFEENPHMTNAWIGLRTFSDDIAFDWQFANGESLNFDLMSEEIQIRAEEKVLEIGKPACLALQHSTESLTWELIDCEMQDTDFMCFSQDENVRRRREVVEPRIRRVFSRVDPVLEAYMFNLPNGYDFLFEDFDEVPIEVVSHLEYDWHWPRYGVLADQKRCVDVVYETYKNLTTSIGKINAISSKVLASVDTTNELNELSILDVNENPIVQEACEIFDEICQNLIDAATLMAELKDKKEYLDQFWQIFQHMTPEKLRKMVENHHTKFFGQWQCNDKVIQYFMELYESEYDFEETEDEVGICNVIHRLVDEARRFLPIITEMVDEYIEQLPFLKRVSGVHCDDVDPEVNLPDGSGEELFCFAGSKKDFSITAEDETENAEWDLEQLEKYYSCLYQVLGFESSVQRLNFRHFLKHKIPNPIKVDAPSNCGDIPIWSELLEKLKDVETNPNFVYVDPELTELANQLTDLADQISELYFATHDYDSSDWSNLAPSIREGAFDPMVKFMEIKEDFDAKVAEIAATVDLLDHYDDYYSDVSDLESLEIFRQFKFDFMNNNLDSVEEASQDLPQIQAKLSQMLDENRRGSIPDLLLDQEDILAEAEDSLKELESIIASSRSLLDRFDENKNSIKLKKGQGASLYNKPDFDNYHSIHFELEFEIRIDGYDSHNVMYIGDGETYLNIDIVNRHVEVIFDHTGAEKKFRIEDNTDLEAGVWYTIKIVDTGSKMWLVVDCKGEVENGQINSIVCDDGGTRRGDMTASESITRVHDNENMIKINGEARKWRMNQENMKMIIGDKTKLTEQGRHTEWSGLEGSV